MRPDNRTARLLIIILTFLLLVSQHGVKGNTSIKEKAEYIDKKSRNVKDNENLLKENENQLESDDNVNDLYKSDPNIDDESTFKERLQEMPVKLGLQMLTAKYALSSGLEKVKRGSFYDAAKDTFDTVVDLFGQGVGNARFLVFGTR